MNFDSAGTDYIDCGILASDIGIDGANAKTMCGWANCHNFAAEGAIFKIGNVGTTDELFSIRAQGTTDDWRADFWNNFIDFTTPTTSLNVWWHFALTYDGTTAKVYNNGAANGSSVESLSTADDFGMYIGIWDLDSSIEFFDGEIADVRVYDRELSLAEIQCIYAARGKDDVVRGLQGRWMLGDGIIGAAVPSSFVDSVENDVGSATSLTITTPSNTDGDLLIAAICGSGNGSGTPPNLSDDSGDWDFIGSVDVPATASTPSLFFWEKEASSEPANYTFSSNQTNTILGHLLCYQNVTVTNDTFGTNTGNSTSASCPTVNAGDDGTFLTLRIAICDSSAANTFADDPYPLGINQRHVTIQSGTGNGCGLVSGDHIRSPGSGNAMGAKVYTLKNSGDQWAAVTITFKANTAVKDISGSTGHPHDADTQMSVTRVEGVLRS